MLKNRQGRRTDAFALAACFGLGLAGPALAQDTAPAAETAPAESGAPASDQPRNAIGDKFELPRMSKDNEVQMIAGLCKISLAGLGEEGCACLADESQTELTAIQRDYLIAAGMAPPVADRMLSDGRIGAGDEAAIKTFLDSTYESCMPASGPAGGAATGTTPKAAPGGTSEGAPANN